MEGAPAKSVEANGNVFSPGHRILLEHPLSPGASAPQPTDPPRSVPAVLAHVPYLGGVGLAPIRDGGAERRSSSQPPPEVGNGGAVAPPVSGPAGPPPANVMQAMARAQARMQELMGSDRSSLAGRVKELEGKLANQHKVIMEQAFNAAARRRELTQQADLCKEEAAAAKAELERLNEERQREAADREKLLEQFAQERAQLQTELARLQTPASTIQDKFSDSRMISEEQLKEAVADAENSWRLRLAAAEEEAAAIRQQLADALADREAAVALAGEAQRGQTVDAIEDEADFEASPLRGLPPDVVAMVSKAQREAMAAQIQLEEAKKDQAWREEKLSVTLDRLRQSEENLKQAQRQLQDSENKYRNEKKRADKAAAQAQRQFEEDKRIALEDQALEFQEQRKKLEACYDSVIDENGALTEKFQQEVDELMERLRQTQEASLASGAALQEAESLALKLQKELDAAHSRERALEAAQRAAAEALAEHQQNAELAAHAASSVQAELRAELGQALLQLQASQDAERQLAQELQRQEDESRRMLGQVQLESATEVDRLVDEVCSLQARLAAAEEASALAGKEQALELERLTAELRVAQAQLSDVKAFEGADKPAAQLHAEQEQELTRIREEHAAEVTRLAAELVQAHAAARAAEAATAAALQNKESEEAETLRALDVARQYANDAERLGEDLNSALAARMFAEQSLLAVKRQHELEMLAMEEKCRTLGERLAATAGDRLQGATQVATAGAAASEAAEDPETLKSLQESLAQQADLLWSSQLRVADLEAELALARHLGAPAAADGQVWPRVLPQGFSAAEAGAGAAGGVSALSHDQSALQGPSEPLHDQLVAARVAALLHRRRYRAAMKATAGRRRRCADVREQVLRWVAEAEEEPSPENRADLHRAVQLLNAAEELDSQLQCTLDKVGPLKTREGPEPAPEPSWGLLSHTPSSLPRDLNGSLQSLQSWQSMQSTRSSEVSSFANAMLPPQLGSGSPSQVDLQLEGLPQFFADVRRAVEDLQRSPAVAGGLQGRRVILQAA